MKIFVRFQRFQKKRFRLFGRKVASMADFIFRFQPFPEKTFPDFGRKTAHFGTFSIILNGCHKLHLQLFEIMVEMFFGNGRPKIFITCCNCLKKTFPACWKRGNFDRVQVIENIPVSNFHAHPSPLRGRGLRGPLTPFPSPRGRRARVGAEN